MPTCIWISTSSNDWTVTGNWSSGTVPAATDPVVFDGTGTADCTTNLPSSPLAYASITVDLANTCRIGSLVAGVATYLKHSAPTVSIGINAGFGNSQGSPLLMFDSGSVACTYTIRDTSSAPDDSRGAVQIKGSNLTINQAGGSVALAARAGETATAIISLIDGNASNVPTPVMYIGAGVTISFLQMNAGQVIDRSTITATVINVNAGTLMYEGTGDCTTLNVNAEGTIVYSGTGAITTMNLTGTFDHTQDTRSVTIGTANLFAGFQLLLDNGSPGTTVFTNPPVLWNSGMAGGTFTTPVGDLV